MAIVDLASLFGNLRNHEEMKILPKEIMRNTHNDRYVALYSKKSPQSSDNDFFDESEGESHDSPALY